MRDEQIVDMLLSIFYKFSQLEYQNALENNKEEITVQQCRELMNFALHIKDMNSENQYKGILEDCLDVLSNIPNEAFNDSYLDAVQKIENLCAKIISVLEV